MSQNGVLCLSEEELNSIVRKEPISEVYHVEETVFARGKYATVRRATHRCTAVQYAAKYIKRRRSSLAGIHHEIAVLLRCRNNARVVRLVEVFETTTDMVLILEFAAGGELQRIFDQDQCLGEDEARHAMRQILEGLAYLHERNIAHLDLKPQNLLLTREDCCEDIKLCDFGVSKVLDPGVVVREMLGTPDYVAPEVINFEPISLASDIWSVGVLTYVLLSGFSPFGSETKHETYSNIIKGHLTFEAEHFGDVSSSAIDFIQSALIREPKKRPTVHELLSHPWLVDSSRPASPRLSPPSAVTLTTCNATSCASLTAPVRQQPSLTSNGESAGSDDSVDGDSAALLVVPPLTPTSANVVALTCRLQPPPPETSELVESSSSGGSDSDGSYDSPPPTPTLPPTPPVCGSTCRQLHCCRHNHRHHLKHPGSSGVVVVTKPPTTIITVDRGILC